MYFSKIPKADTIYIYIMLFHILIADDSNFQDASMDEC